MNKKIWGIIIVIIGFLILAGIIYFFFFYKPAAPKPAVNQPATRENQAAITPKPAESTNQPAAIQPLSPLKRPEITADDLAIMAASFAERFGSFSNQSDYGNLRDLQVFMTENLKSWSEDYIETARLKKADTLIYYGVVTKAVSSEIKKFESDLGQAEILVKTQRRELAGAAANSSTFYQDITVKYLREGTIWRVDGVYWQEK
ncbi:MAG: hypothetical protein Q7K35_01580 [bacterium]|nr:hypothetical protein [bacterium]